MTRENPRTPFESWRRWGGAGFLLFGLAGVVGLSVGILVGEDRGWIAGGLVGSLIALIRISRPVRKEPWFWATVAVFAAADILAIIRFNWSATHAWTGRAYSGLIALDLGVMMAIIYGLYRLLYGPPAEIIEDIPEEPRYGERDIL